MREKFPGYQVEVDKQALRLDEVYERAASCEACATKREATDDADALCERHWTELIAAEKMGEGES